MANREATVHADHNTRTGASDYRSGPTASQSRLCRRNRTHPSDARLASLLLSPLVTLRNCARVPIFWVLFGTFFVCGCSTNGLIQTHFVALCHDYGLAATAAASVLAMMGAFDFIGTIGSGWLSDRFDNRWLLFWY